VKISGQTQRMPQKDLRAASGAAHLAFFNVGSLFSTHPSLEKRLAQLERISRQLSTDL
jgi:heat shock protein HtpX